ncbi:hypothetical protein CASFOL_029815 [Castilleja foliolosa]|uniref:Uncharacterized protein n=1 Tax=Castilleja foliolosa TaxID=1961234 RepID=A0ABD3CAC2_9LAMI
MGCVLGREAAGKRKARRNQKNGQPQESGSATAAILRNGVAERGRERKIEELPGETAFAMPELRLRRGVSSGGEGWPSWLNDVAGQAIKDWKHRRANTFEKLDKLFIFGFIGDLLGGANFNPTATAAFYAAGLGGPDSLISAAIRFPAQAAGAVGGAVAILEVMPIQYKHMLQGPSLKVDLQTGAIAEGVLTFVITLAVLIIVIRGPRSPIIKNALLATSTVSLIVAGSGYTGPSMNPANFVAGTQPINSLAFVFDGIVSSSQAFARITFSNSLKLTWIRGSNRLIVECHRKISRALKRLDDEDAKAAIAISVSEVTQTEETNELSKQIKEKLKEIDQFIVPHQLRSAIDKQSLLYLTLKNDGKIVVNNASEVASTTSYQSTGNLPGTSTFTPTTPVPKSSTSKRQLPESPGQDKRMKRA